MKNTLDEVLTDETLRRLAGGTVYARGRDYFASGQVANLVEYEGRITARVYGTHTYRVELWDEDGELGYDCTCPYMDDYGFCKHCVAVGLAWLQARAQAAPIPGGSPPEPKITMEDVKAYLERQDPSKLVAMIMELAMEDASLRERLILKASLAAKRGIDVSRYLRAIDRAVETGGYIDYDEVDDYIERVDTVAQSLADLLEEGYGEEVMTLAEHALQGLEAHIEEVDDQNGEIIGLMARIEQLYHDACVIAKPDPEALAERLFERELGADWDDVFDDSVTRYADVLGEKGIAAFRRMVEERWSRVKPLYPGDQSVYGGERFRITQMMEDLARQSGDIEALVEIKRRNLSTPLSFHQIAQIYQQAGQEEEALGWAEEGLRSFPDKPDNSLRTFVADAYHRQNRHEEAMALIWALFTERPYLDSYQILKRHADQTGQWPLWREKALALMRENVAEQKASPQPFLWTREPDHSALVEALLWEKLDEAAWQEAQQGGCSHELWIRLADIRRESHPEDALAVYLRQVEPTIEQTNNVAYEAAVALLRKIRDIQRRLGRQADFNAYVQYLRATYRRKRNFIALLDQERW